MARQKRKKVFIDPTVQGALLRRLLLHWCCFAFGSAWTIIILQVMLQGIEHPMSYHLKTVWQQYGVLFVVMACFLPAFVYDSIKLSHRFAGPVFKLRQSLKTIALGGDPGPLTFRKGDFWADIAGDVNRINERLNTKDEQAKPAVGAAAEEELETSAVS